MKIAELNLSNIGHIIGNIIQVTTSEVVEEAELSFNPCSKDKLSQLISTGIVTKDNQNLVINSLVINQEYEELLTKGQSPWVKTSNGYALTTKPISPPHFCAKIQALATHKKDSSMFYAIEIFLSNFSFDFSNSCKIILDKEVEFKNVGMTVYPGKITVKILED